MVVSGKITVDLNFFVFHRVKYHIDWSKQKALSLFLYLDLTIGYPVNFSVMHAERSRIT